MSATTATVIKQVSPMEILENRRARKEAGLVGCMSRKSGVSFDPYGYRDVMCWNIDINGKFPDQEGYDYTNPNCFCFDCRDAFDSEGITDAELVNAGNTRACFVYGSQGMKQPSEDLEKVNEDEHEDDDHDETYHRVEGLCEDCGKKDATQRFMHLDSRHFNLCLDCFHWADHEDDYLAHVKPPRYRVSGMRMQSSNGFSNESTLAAPAESLILPVRTNGGGIQAI
jgi:hypothetical protein